MQLSLALKWTHRSQATRLFASSVRPSKDDVERISRGQAAKKRGTGSRQVPHRLNEAERKEWDLAKKRRFVAVRGTGWRKERGDSPLLNIYRQLCDALDIPSISLLRGVTEDDVATGHSMLVDIVNVDLSPLRRLDVSNVAREMAAEAQRPGAYTSLLGVQDNSNVSGLLHDAPEIHNMLNEDVIWRIPAYGLEARFLERKDAKLYAESIARQFAGGREVEAASSTALDVEDE